MKVHSQNAGTRRNKYKCFDNERYKLFKINLDKTLALYESTYSKCRYT